MDEIYRGSEWRKWDLHFHTPSSYDYQDGSVTNQDIIDGLFANNISVVAITDHHIIDIPRITELQQLGKEKGITVLPGIEMIIKKDTLEIIGDLGFKGFNCEEQNIDLGYGIIKEERQKGFAAEAVNEILKWAFSNEIIKEITANCLTENISSINLLNKFKFRQVKTENDMIYWNLLNPNH